MQGRLGSFGIVRRSWRGAAWWDVTLNSAFLSNCVKPMILFPAIHTSELHPSFASWDSCTWTFWPATAFIHLQCHASKAISTHAFWKRSCSGSPCPLCHHQHSKILPVSCFHPPSRAHADQIFSMTCWVVFLTVMHDAGLHQPGNLWDQSWESGSQTAQLVSINQWMRLYGPQWGLQV